MEPSGMPDMMKPQLMDKRVEMNRQTYCVNLSYSEIKAERRLYNVYIQSEMEIEHKCNKTR